MNEIKPCFCGSTKINIKKRMHSAGMDGCYENWEFYCEKCGCTISYAADGFYGRKYWKTKEEAIDQWNKDHGKTAMMNTCEKCKYRTEHHYEEEGEHPYIKLTCGNKYGLNNEYQIHDYDYCSRFEQGDENGNE